MKKRSFWQENLKNQLGVGAEINSADSYCLVHQRQKIRRKNEGKERDFLKNPSRIATHKHKGQGPRGRGQRAGERKRSNQYQGGGYLLSSNAGDAGTVVDHCNRLRRARLGGTLPAIPENQGPDPDRNPSRGGVHASQSLHCRSFAADEK